VNPHEREKLRRATRASRKSKTKLWGANGIKAVHGRKMSGERYHAGGKEQKEKLEFNGVKILFETIEQGLGAQKGTGSGENSGR